VKKKKKKSNFSRNLILGIVCLALLFTIIYEIILIRRESMQPEDIYEETSGEEETESRETETGETEEPEESEESEEPEQDKEPEQYERPSYKFLTEEITVEIRGLSKEYTLAWVSDLHMITDKEAADDILEADLETIKDRYETLSVTEDGVHGEELWPEIIKFLNYGHYDGIIFGGDLMDYCSRSNMDAFVAGYKKLNSDVPVLYVRADHDYGFWYGGDAVTEEMTHEMHTKIDGDDVEEKYLNFNDEFMVVGVNASTKNLPAEEMRIIREQMETGIPVILATHVPFSSQIQEQEADLEELSMEVRNKIYYWGGPDYQPNEVTQELLDKIYWEHTPVKQVLAGHLHASWDGMLTEKVPQHIFTPAFEGVLGVVHVVPKE